MTNKLEIHLFGQFSICAEKDLLKVLKAQKAKELFCYLLLYCDRSHHRELLSDVLWGDQQNARKYLRKTLWQLKGGLNNLDETSDCPLLNIEGDWLQINPDADIWVDAHVFEKTYQSVKEIKGSELSFSEFNDLRKVIKLYTGELFERMYCDWCIFERERFREIYLAMAAKLMDYCTANHEYQAGIEYGKLILHEDKVHERTYRKLMRLYYLTNDRVEAIRRFEECKACLAEELLVQPSKRTQDLYRDIINDEVSSESAAPSSQAQISRSLERIRRLMDMQASIDKRLPREIQKLEQALAEIE
jgi:DNA-binding SARP family transcriptional activator